MPQKTYTLKSPSGKEYKVDWTKDTDPTDDDFRKIISHLAEMESPSTVDESKTVTGATFSKPSVEEPPQQGLVPRAWNWINTPIKALEPYARLAGIVAAPQQYGVGEKLLGPKFSDAEIAKKSAESAAGMVTPMSLAFMGLGGIEGLAARQGIPWLWNAASRATRLASLGFAEQGLEKTIQTNPLEDPLGFGQGLAQVAGGAVGMRNRGTAVGTIPRPKFAEPPVVEPETPPMSKALVPTGQGVSFAPTEVMQESLSKYNLPRFIAGRAGVADATSGYVAEPPVPKVPGIDEVINQPDLSLRARPAVLPDEVAPETVNVGPFIGASGLAPVRPYGLNNPFTSETSLGSPQKDVIGNRQFDLNLNKVLDRTVKRPQESEADITPQFARTESGGVKIGADIKSLGKVLGSSLYQGDIGKIVTKELLQNSIDATRHLGPDANIEVHFGHDRKLGADVITVIDNGKGLTKRELETVFTDLGSSGKRDDPNASGGFGLAKAAPLLGGQKVSVSTIVEENGRKFEHSFEGTPDELLNGVNIRTEELPPDAETGTYVSTILPKGSYTYEGQNFLDSIVQNSPGLEHNIKKFEEEFDSANYSYKPKEVPLKVPRGRKYTTVSESNPLADIEISVPEDTKYGEFYPHYQILNNKVWQGSVASGWQPISGIPEEVLVNIKSNVEEGHPDYPWTANRESLRGPVQNLVNDLVDKYVFGPAKEMRAQKLRDVYDNMPEMTIPTGSPRTFHFYNVADRMTPEEVEALINNPKFQELGAYVADTLNSIIQNTGEIAEQNKLKKIGFIFDNSLHGIHIPRPGSKEATSAILINPFLAMMEGDTNQAASSIFHTIAHEVAHVPGHGHNEAFTIKLADIYSKYGADKAIADQLELKNAIGGQRYSPEIQDLLRTYKDVTRRGGSEKDALLGTGIKQANNGPTGEGKVPGSNNPNGNGASEEVLRQFQTTIAGSIEKLREQKALYSKERSARLGRFMNTGIGEGVEGFSKRMSQLKGKLPKVEPPKLNLTATQVGQLIDMAHGNPNLYGYENVRAQAAINKMARGGELLNDSEIKVLNKAFGPFTGQMIKTLNDELGDAGFIQFSKPHEGFGRELLGLPRAALVTGDLSLTFRQGSGLAHTREFWRAWKDLAKAVGSEEFYKINEAAIKDHPEYEPWTEVGLKLTDFESSVSREENIPLGMNLAERLDPTTIIFGEKEGLIRKTNRGNNLFINKIRWDVARRLYSELGGTIDLNSSKPFSNPELAEAVANYVNNATGRGSSKRKMVEAAMPLLNEFLFAPRWQLATMKFLNPLTYMKYDQGMRQEYWKSLFSKASVWAIMSGLAFAMGKVLSPNDTSMETDPRSSDFLKVRTGDIRTDATMGSSKYVSLITKVLPALLGQDAYAKSPKTGELYKLGGTPVTRTPLQVVQDFGTNLLAPIPRLIATMLRQKDFNGAPINVKNEVIKSVIPMILQDLYEIGMKDPNLFPLSIMGALGAGIQTYSSGNEELVSSGIR